MRNGDDTAEVRRKRGWARYQLESFDNALEDYSKAITLDAGNVDNFNERGLVRHGMQAYMAAISDFDQALKLQSDNAVVLTNRALSYSRLGNVERGAFVRSANRPFTGTARGTCQLASFGQFIHSSVWTSEKSSSRRSGVPQLLDISNL